MRVAAFCTALAASATSVALAAIGIAHSLAVVSILASADFIDATTIGIPAAATLRTGDMHHDSGPYMRFRNRAMRVRSPVSHRS